MNRAKWLIAIAAAIVVIAGVGWFRLKQYNRLIGCQQRDAAFERRVESIKQDAHRKLTVGRKKDEVALFYTEHRIPFEVVRVTDAGFEAIGTLYTTGGCAPLGCGTNNAVIGVRVKVDADGSVTAEPEVVGMYTDCV